MSPHAHAFAPMATPQWIAQLPLALPKHHRHLFALIMVSALPILKMFLDANVTLASVEKIAQSTLLSFAQTSVMATGLVFVMLILQLVATHRLRMLHVANATKDGKVQNVSFQQLMINAVH